MRLPEHLRDRFLSKIRETASGCHVWTDALTWGGYGRFRIGTRKYQAHRVAYETFVGPIPPGLHIDHLCRNRACVNPAHLEPVTPSENVLRGVSPSARNAVKTHCIHGHPLTRRNLENDREGFRRCTECRRRRGREYARRQRELAAQEVTA